MRNAGKQENRVRGVSDAFLPSCIVPIAPWIPRLRDKASVPHSTTGAGDFAHFIRRKMAVQRSLWNRGRKRRRKFDRL